MSEQASHKPGLLGIWRLPNDDPRKTVAVAVVLCLVCSLVVSTAAVTLRPLQAHNASLALKREVVKVAGLYQPGGDVAAAFAKLDTRLIDLDTGEYVTDMDPAEYDPRKAAEDPKQSTRLTAEQDKARIHNRPNVMPVYLLYEGDRHDARHLKTIILPINGYGLWSTMYGLLALGPDGRTVKNVSFYEQGETAGLGGEVANPKWEATWDGKEVADQQGDPRFTLVKGGVDPQSPEAKYHVDALSGATLTSNGVTNLMHFWIGKMGYGPFLARIRAERGT